MHNKRPSFGGKCSLCLGCIYRCPKNALRPRIGSFVVLKQGYHLELFKEKDPQENKSDIRRLAKKSGYTGLIRYLREYDD
jgi:ferredoxin